MEYDRFFRHRIKILKELNQKQFISFACIAVLSELISEFSNIVFIYVCPFVSGLLFFFLSLDTTSTSNLIKQHFKLFLRIAMYETNFVKKKNKQKNNKRKMIEHYY